MVTGGEDELKPCPFCGGQGEVSKKHEGATFWAYCRTNSCVVLPDWPYRATAVDAWNTRAPSPEVEAAVRHGEQLQAEAEAARDRAITAKNECRINLREAEADIVAARAEVEELHAKVEEARGAFRAVLVERDAEIKRGRTAERERDELQAKLAEAQRYAEGWQQQATAAEAQRDASAAVIGELCEVLGSAKSELRNHERYETGGTCHAVLTAIDEIDAALANARKVKL